MYGVILTQYDGKILGPIAIVLGWILDKIFFILDKINFPNAALAIILFTIVIYLLLTPLTIKQQKFSKLSAKLQQAALRKPCVVMTVVRMGLIDT